MKAFFAKHGAFASSLHRAPHGAGGTAGDRLVEVAPYLGKSDLQIRVMRAQAAVGSAVAAAKGAPGFIAGLRKKLVERGPVLVAHEEWKDARPAFEQKADRS